MEVLAAMRVIKAFTREEDECQRYGMYIQRSLVLGQKRALASASFAGGVY